MRKSIVIIAAACLLAIPLVGTVGAQQMPGEINKNPPPSLAQLQKLVSAQTEAITDLHKRVTALETRVTELEAGRTHGQ